MPTFWRVFIINECWILSTAFSASIEISIWILSFNLLIWCITLIDWHLLKYPCIPGINHIWSWCMIFLMCCWILLPNIYWEILHLYSVIEFLWLLCLVFVSGWWWPHTINFGVFLPLRFFWRVWEEWVLTLF